MIKSENSVSIRNNKKRNENNFMTQYKNLNSYVESILTTIKFKDISIQRLEDKLFYIINKSDNELIAPFQWHEIINLGNIELLRFANEIRAIYVDGLRNLLTNYLESHCKFSQKYDTYCEANAVGSTDLTSNYNIIVTSFSLSTHIVENFNQYFFQFWNDTSGSIFDTNIYGNTFFINIRDTITYNVNLDRLYNHIKTADHKSIFYLPPKEEYLLPDTKNIIFREQLGWLIIKIKLYNDEIIKVTKKKLQNSSSLQNSSNLQNYSDPNLNNLQGLIMEILTKIFNVKNIEETLTNLDEKYNTLNSEKPTKDLPGKKENEYRRQMDLLYVKKLKIIDENHDEYKALLNNDSNNHMNKKNKVLLKLIDSISENDFFGNETYFCIGTIYHVVGYIQNLAQFHMYKEYYIHSMIENLIDTFRYYEYMKSDYKRFLLKASKYIYRAYDAMTKYLEMNNGSRLTNLNLNNKKKIFHNIRNFYKKKSNEDLSQELFNSFKVLSKNTNTNSENIDNFFQMIINDIKNTLGINEKKFKNN